MQIEIIPNGQLDPGVEPAVQRLPWEAFQKTGKPKITY